MYKASTYLVGTYFPTYLPTYETYFLQNWLPRWNWILTQLRFIHNWVLMGVQWMVRWWVPVHCGPKSEPGCISGSSSVTHDFVSKKPFLFTDVATKWPWSIHHLLSLSAREKQNSVAKILLTCGMSKRKRRSNAVSNPHAQKLLIDDDWYLNCWNYLQIGQYRLLTVSKTTPTFKSH